MKKIYLIRAVKILSLSLAVVLCCALLQETVLCRADHNRERVKGFYLEAPDSLDLVLMGASEVYSDFAPSYCYGSKGITSYLYATQANTILNYKAQLKNILKTQAPKLIVVELNGALYPDDEEVTKEANLRNYIDNAPLDPDKLEWISHYGRDNTAEYLAPLIKYHGVWKDFPDDVDYTTAIMNNKLRGYSYLKGTLNETKIYKSSQRIMNSMLSASTDSKKPITKTQETALRELLQFCKDEKLENVVFARFPHLVTRRTFDRFERGNYAGEIVNEYGFDFLNFEAEFTATGLDEKSDFYNLDHLNIYGQKKFTDFLADFLSERYGIGVSVLSEEQANNWQTCAEYYNAYYAYSDSLIKKGVNKELSENAELISELDKKISIK